MNRPIFRHSAKEKSLEALERREEFIDAMRQNMEIQDDAYVGTFWYLPAQKRLLFVEKASAETVKPNQYGQRTTTKLHVTIWQKQKNHALSKGEPWPYGKDYTLLPQGRVWEQDGKYIVTVGKWLESMPTAKQLILDEFELPVDAEFRYDSHWDIGSGWSGDRLN